MPLSWLPVASSVTMAIHLCGRLHGRPPTRVLLALLTGFTSVSLLSILLTLVAHYPTIFRNFRACRQEGHFVPVSEVSRLWSSVCSSPLFLETSPLHAIRRVCSLFFRLKTCRSQTLFFFAVALLLFHDCLFRVPRCRTAKGLPCGPELLIRPPLMPFPVFVPFKPGFPYSSWSSRSACTVSCVSPLARCVCYSRRWYFVTIGYFENTVTIQSVLVPLHSPVTHTPDDANHSAFCPR